MAEYGLLKNAPIVEAIIDIRIKKRSEFDVKLVEHLHDKIRESYPNIAPQLMFETKFEFKKDEIPASKMKEPIINGYMFTTLDKKQVFQARLDGFTFNRLKPYEKWNNFRDEAKKLWEIYKELIMPEVTRIALRYVNKFDIPIPSTALGEYLNAPPIIPKGLPEGMLGFLTRVIIYEPEIKANAVITQVLEQIVENKFASIILDIDAFFQQEEGIKEDEIWHIYENLKDLKNKIFFLSITEKTKELFK